MLAILDRELLLFCAFWMFLGALDELAVDGIWLWLRRRGGAREERIARAEAAGALRGRAAVLIAAWQESDVIALTIAHALRAWVQDDFVLYVGCYRNDMATIAAAMAGAGGDTRIRIVVHDIPGPTTKADCLNRLYTALCEDEAASCCPFRLVLLHDSEDMVHPAELAVVDAALERVDFVQLPVRPEPHPASRWIGGHYLDEFAESHGKALAVRQAIGAAIPAAGVGCAFGRRILARLAARRISEGGQGPFAADCLTEDYEMGLLVGLEGGRSSFVRVRDEKGDLVATRAYFPATLEAAVRQKARWLHGISFQGWDRLGWGMRLADRWMLLRDRRGPMTAFVLAGAYLLVLVELVRAVFETGVAGGSVSSVERPLALEIVLWICTASLLWRAAMRVWFTGREYGVAEAARALLRIPVANMVAILAARRALFSYSRTLRGGSVKWEKTRHDLHPVGTVQAGVRQQIEQRLAA